MSKKLSLLVIIIFFILTNFALSEDLYFLEIDFLGEKTKILTTLREKDSEIYIPLPLFSSTFKYEYKIDGSAVYLYRSEKLVFIGVIGERKATLEEKTVNLFNPIIRENNIVYLPVSSFFRILGYRVYLKDKILYIVNEMSKIEYSKGILNIEFKGKSLVDFNSFVLNNPSRFVIDLLNVVFINNKGEIKSNDSVIKSIRFSQFNVAPYVVRVVIEYKKEIIKPDILKDVGKIVIKFPVKILEDDKKNLKLIDLSWEDSKESLTFFLKFSDSNFTYTRKYLLDPPRYYYDFPNTVLGLTYNELFLNKGIVNSIRIGERKEESSLRVVFETYTDNLKVNEEIYTDTLKIIMSQNIDEKKKETKNNKFSIFIDPGHGGNDPGAVFGELKEKDLNLKVSLLLANKLISKGYEVILTRDKDITVSLDDRVKFINNNLVSMNNNSTKSILVSIHTNAAFSAEVKGIELCYATDLSEKLVKTLLDVFKNRGLMVRRAIKGRFYILSRVSIPSVIIEMGFITNEDDRKLLLSEDFQVKLVDIIIEALEEYIRGEGGNE